MYYNIISIKNKMCLLLQKLERAIWWTTSWSPEFLMLKYKKDASYRQQFDYSFQGEEFNCFIIKDIRKQLEKTNYISYYSQMLFLCGVQSIRFNLYSIPVHNSWREFNDWHIIGQLIRMRYWFFSFAYRRREKIRPLPKHRLWI